MKERKGRKLSDEEKQNLSKIAKANGFGGCTKGGGENMDRLKMTAKGVKEQINADVAQLVEQLICNQLVGGSIPSIGSETG